MRIPPQSRQEFQAELARDDFVSVCLEILDFDPKFQQKDEEESSHLPLGRNPSGFVESQSDLGWKGPE